MLQSCPSGYELDAAAQECHLCPAFSYCVGGAAAHVTCPGGQFASPGSTSSLSCYKAIFSVVSVKFPVLFNEILAANQAQLQLKVSSYAGVPSGSVIVDSISSVAVQSTRIVFLVASADIELEMTVAAKLSSNLADPSAFASENLPASVLDALTVTACAAGFELIVTAASLTGNDGKCALCPASYYCAGGTLGRASCPTGTYSPPGASASSLCTPAVFVSVSVLLPLSAGNVTEATKAKLVQAFSLAAQVPEDKVMITSIEPAQRRNAGAATSLVKAQIAASDLNSASAVSKSLDVSALNSALLSVGLPPGSLNSVTIVSSVYESTGTPPWVMSISIVGGFLVLSIILLVVAYNILDRHETADEQVLRLKVAEIRRQLKITKEDGYFLTSERPFWWQRSKEAIFLRRIHIEAAARLALGQEFDVPLFDAFCLSLEDGKEDGKKGTLEDRYLALAEWLLELGAELIRPDEEDLEVPCTSSKRPPAPVRFHYFLHKVGRARIWTEVNSLFPRLQSRASEFMGEIARKCELRYQDLCAEERGQQLLAVQPEGQQFEKVGGKGVVAARTRAYWRIRVTRSETNLMRGFPGLDRQQQRRISSPVSAKVYSVLATRQDGSEVRKYLLI